MANAYLVLEKQPEQAASAREILRAVAAPLATFAVNIEVVAEANLLIPTDQCGPIAIIVNEAICNALKHGYPPGRVGRITVSMTAENDGVELVIANDGLPMTTASGPGRGSNFINILAHQMGGKVSLRNIDPTGVAMTIRF